MNLKEAYEVIKKYNADKRLVECLEFEDFYAFAFSKEDNLLFDGTYDVVDKTTGKISVFNPIENLDELFKAKVISADIIKNDNKLHLFYVKEQLKELLYILEQVYMLEAMNKNALKMSHVVRKINSLENEGHEPNLSEVLEHVKAIAPYCDYKKIEEERIDDSSAYFMIGLTYIKLKSAVIKIYPAEFCREVVPLILESHNRVINAIADREWVVAK